MVSNGWHLDQMKQNNQPPHQHSDSNMQQHTDDPTTEKKTLQTLSTGTGVVASYAACSQSDDWFVSPRVITCSYESRVYGFTADPRDCSQFYICDQTPSGDGTSKGYLMTCVAGLWWDQGKRMCASPAEVSCNPFTIINTQGGTSMILKFKNLYQIFPNFVITISLNKVDGKNSDSSRCVSCNEVGLTLRSQMISVQGKPSSL
jgi:hypothetical protein